MKTLSRLLLSTAVLFICGTALSAEELSCPSSEVGREAFASGEATSWPNYSEGTAARVQRQHPDTGLWAQAKFIDWGSGKFAICQYYNHVGLLMTIAYVGYDRADLDESSYWREEYAEESADLDRPGRKMLSVCMKNEGDVAYPSVGCQFNHIDAD